MYERGLGDKLLGLSKKFTSAEFRHNQLGKLAYFMSFLGSKPVSGLERVIDFDDGSKSLRLASPVMLASGGNKTGEYAEHFGSLGYGGITLGSFTRDAREGNPHRPRVALIEEDYATQNAMGLNGLGIYAFWILGRLDNKPDNFSIGISVAETPGLEGDEKRLKDVMGTFRMAYDIGDYVEVNLSCPNTGDKRVDREYEFIEKLLGYIEEHREDMDKNYRTFGVLLAEARGLEISSERIPAYVKLSPDMDPDNLENVLGLAQDKGINGCVLFNTWPYDNIPKGFLKTEGEKIRVLNSEGGRGGISGRPLYPNVKEGVRFVKEEFPGLSIFACGGIENGWQVRELEDLGADASQILTVNGYRWMAAKKICKEYKRSRPLI